ncbi:MAG: AAA family ATPase [Chloroflexota bacterium]
MVLPTLSVHLLGGFRIYWGEAALSDRFKPRLQALIAYLLLHKESALSRQQVAFHFWPDTTEAQARANVRKSVYRLRQSFPEVDEYLELQGATFSRRAGTPLWLDVAEFETALEAAAGADVSQRASLLQAAISLYKGDLLPDLYDDWVLAARERLRRRYLHALQALAKLHEQQRDYASGIALVRQLLRQDPLVEEGYRHLMRLQALNGDVAGALRTYHRCARQLEQELGVEPGQATQQAYRRLLDRREEPQVAVARHTRRQFPLVGREEAWGRLLDAWKLVAAAGPQVVVISGEAGVGKTRLAEELLRWTDRQGIPTLSAACFASETPLPLQPIGDWLRSQAVESALPGLAPRWRSELARLLPELLAADSALETPQPMTESWQQQHFFMALAEAVTAAGEPLLLFLDDLHWADAETLDWLHFLAQQKGDHRFLLVGAVRTEELAPDHPLLSWQEALARLLRVHAIALERLGPADTAALAASVLGRSLPEERAASLHRETEGNPLFTVEMVRAGLSGEGAPLPEKMRSVIEIRLNRLSTPAQEAAALAAVIGRRFAFPLLQAASPQSEIELLDSVDELWQRQIIREHGEDAYDFSHDKIRQVALEQLSGIRRRWWHGRVAEALEQLSAGDLESVYGQLAAHWEGADRSERAGEHYLLAARAASRLYAHQEALAHLRQALALLPANDARRTDIYAYMGEASMALGQFEEAATAFQEAANRTDDVAARVHNLARRVLSLRAGGQLEEARSTYRRALSLMEAEPVGEWPGEIWRTWIELHLSLLEVLYFASESDEMQRVCQAMARPLELYGAAHQHAEYLAAVSRMHCRLRRYRLTDEHVATRQAALRWARETEDDILIADHQFGLGFILIWAGKPVQALAMLQQAAGAAEALGNVPLQSRCLTYLGIAYRMVDDEARVRESVEKLAPVVAAANNRTYLGVAQALQAWLQWRTGAMEAAENHGRAALRQWGAAIPPYPMQWLARLPLLVVACTRTDSTVDAREQARVMLLPSQQRLPDPLAEALQATVSADSTSAVARHVREVSRLAREYGYL